MNRLNTIWLIIFTIMMLAACGLPSKNQSSQDFLLVWGQVADQPGEPWKSCQLQSYNPKTQDVLTLAVRDDRVCSYAVVDIEGQQRLISQEPNDDSPEKRVSRSKSGFI